jgi:hypothetical protein
MSVWIALLKFVLEGYFFFFMCIVIESSLRISKINEKLTYNLIKHLGIFIAVQYKLGASLYFIRLHLN